MAIHCKKLAQYFDEFEYCFHYMGSEQQLLDLIDLSKTLFATWKAKCRAKEVHVHAILFGNENMDTLRQRFKRKFKRALTSKVMKGSAKTICCKRYLAYVMHYIACQKIQRPYRKKSVPHIHYAQEKISQGLLHYGEQCEEVKKYVYRVVKADESCACVKRYRNACEKKKEAKAL